MRYAKGTTLISETRDIPVLREVRNAKFISHSQLFELMQLTSAEYSREAFTWRVRRLVRRGYISRLEGEFGRGMIVYQITRRGLIQLENHCLFATVLNSQTAHLPHPSQVHHALELTEVRLALLRKNLLLAWKSDVEIASENTISSFPFAKDYDAIVDVWNDEQAARFGLEYERTVKGFKEYDRIREALEAENVIKCILYLTSGNEVSLHLAREFSGIAKRIAFSTAKAFREGLLDTPVLTFPEEQALPFRNLLGGVF